MKFFRPLTQKLIKNVSATPAFRKAKSEDDLFRLLLDSGISIELIKKEFRGHYGVDFVDIENYQIEAELLKKFDLSTLKAGNMLPIKEDKATKTFYFAVGDLVSGEAKAIASKAAETVGYSVIYNFAIPSHIEKKHQDIEKNKIAEIVKLSNKEVQKTSNENPIGETFDAKVWIDELINKGIDMGASDVHIEQFEGFVRVRHRVDGGLRVYGNYNFSEGQVSSIGVVVKMISELDISEKRKPQDGRIDDHRYNGKRYDLRVSTVATINGEKFTFRIFENKSDIASFKDLGFSNKHEEMLKKILENKNGIIYLAGATGSGKTTTLYTMINHKNTEDVNIYTIENPVEKSINDVNQIQVNELAGITYLSTLRALLRQDPDIIVVGETRDKETAELSVRASLTGHLVITTIHANNAIDSISRIVDMGIEPYLIGASSLGFISQRLVKKLCPHCKERVTSLEPFQEKWLAKNARNKDFNLAEHEIYTPKGCSKCYQGYKGRTVVVEILAVDDEIRSLIAKGTNITEIRQIAIRDGFEPFILDGVDKVLKGITSIEEVMREID